MPRRSKEEIWNQIYDPNNNQIKINTVSANPGTNTSRHSIEEIFNQTYDPTNRALRTSGTALAEHGAELHNIQTEPGTPDTGDLWYDTSTNELKVWVE